MKILVNAYAVCPNRGSEEGMGWNWCSNLAKLHELYIITESEFREQIETFLHNETAEYAQRMHFFFVPIGETEEETAKIRQMCWNQGNWAFYPKYAKWQEKALLKAREIIAMQEAQGAPIQMMHQLNMAGFREPGMLYRINEQRVANAQSRIPLVWGPMTGYSSIPFRFLAPGGMKFTAFYMLKNFLNELQIRFHPRVRKMMKEADAFIAATPEMQEGLQRVYGVQVEHISETATRCSEEADVSPITPAHNASDGTFRLLWVGRFIYTKQLPLALKVLTQLRDIPNVELHIVGRCFTDDETAKMHQLAKDLKVDDLCRWHGQIANAEVHKLMQTSHLFFFSSISEATSTVILEAITNHLPIVCFNRCGFGPIVDDSIGRKIECTTPRQAIADFSRAIHFLYQHPELRESMRQNCADKKRELSWETKMLRVNNLYRQAPSNLPLNKGRL